MSSLISALHIPTKKHSTGGPFMTRVPCNPEASVGLQAALMEPVSADLHVAKPVRCSARGITLAVTTNRYYMMTSSSFCDDDNSLVCKLCDCRMDGRVIYMYMSKGFCTEACRNDYYFLDYRYRLTMAMEAEGRRFRSEARKAPPVAEGDAANGYRCIFFTCAEVESFP